MLIDARLVDNGQQFECDLCVVGSGPAGIAIVDRLRDSHLKVLLVESGGFNLDLPTQKLYQGEVHGDDYFRLDACRWRLFGGTSARWGGWCRPMEADDYAQRDWVPHSGWPITAESLTPYHDAAAKLFELPNARFGLNDWAARLPKSLPLEGAELQPTVFQHSPETDFGETYRERVLAAGNVTTLIHANLTQIRLAPGTQRVDSLDIATLNGKKFSVRPRAVVIAAGGIENARLLLASTADRPSGLGNQHDMVGRCFMEHLHVPVGHMLAPQASNWDQTFFAKAVFDDVRLRGVLTPTADGLKRHRLLTTSIAIEKASFSYGTPFVGWPPPLTFRPVKFYRAKRRGRIGATVEYIKHTAERFEGIPRRLNTLRIARKAMRGVPSAQPSDRVFSLYFRAEQAPDWSNRITLLKAKDALGMPKTRLDWEVKPIDQASIASWLDVLDGTLRERGLGQVIPPKDGWQKQIIGGPHHMGTTRMSADPKTGVVDQDCKVHSVDNLYIAGSSVFATSGYVNPNYTLVLLALRLADTLRLRLG